jgi:multiple sugar transport system permease protein
MASQSLPRDFSASQRLERSLERQRWARVGWVYGSLSIVGVIFIGVFYVAFITSLKSDPLEWPFKFGVAQLNPANWSKAASLGSQGAGNLWTGGFAPGANVTFNLTYFVPSDRAEEPLIYEISRRTPGSRLVSLDPGNFAADFATSTLSEVSRRDGTFTRNEQVLEGQFIDYALNVTYEDSKGDGRSAQRLPVDFTSPAGYVLVDSTLPPDRIERRGRVASWDTITPGFAGFAFKNYIRVFRESYDRQSGSSLFWRWTVNSFFIALAKVLTTLLFASTAGYALARMKFPGRQALFFIMLFSMMVPGQVTFISNYLVLRDAVGLRSLFPTLTLLNNPWGIIVSGLVATSAVFIMKQFFETMPREIEEAARIDGANPIQTFFRVMLPMAGPALGALTILNFQGAWNDFFWPLVVLTTKAGQTLPVGLLSFRTAYGPAGDWGLILAGAFLSMIPIIILFIVFQRYFVEGVSFSGGKE